MRPQRRLLLVPATLVLIVAALLLSRLSRITPHVRDQAIAALEERFDSEAHLASLQVSVFPRPEVSGAGLSLSFNGRTDLTPMIRLESFSASAGLWGLLKSPLRLRTVELQGLVVNLPAGTRPSMARPARRGDTKPSSEGSTSRASSSMMTIDRIVARSAQLEIVPREETKLPRVFEIHDLVMRGLGDGSGSAFSASLTNPKPRGEITTQGTFGPWRSDEPRQTPVRGEYAFNAANLNTIKGIAGTLSSTGAYSGVLERIEVKGDTDTPDFSIDIAGQPVHLKTSFQAVVDGTNGDTWLERVEARVAETLILARGAVVRAKEVKGRRITLDVTIDDGRIEDVLKLGMKAAKPVMTGRVRLKTAFLLPAGDRDVLDKLELTGTFSLDRARFSNMNIQQRINTLSRRAKGEPDDDSPSVVSRLSGRFALRHGTLAFSDLSFGVPGAVVQIAGTYDIRRELLDFRGHLLLDATLAETTSGFKSILARAAQPLFRRPGGGSKIPIRISGARAKPEFGLDVRRALGPG